MIANALVLAAILTGAERTDVLVLEPAVDVRESTIPSVDLPFVVRGDRAPIAAELVLEGRASTPVKLEAVFNDGVPVPIDLGAELVRVTIPVDRTRLRASNAVRVQRRGGVCGPVPVGTWRQLAGHVRLTTKAAALPLELSLLPLPLVDRDTDRSPIVTLVLAGEPTPERVRAAMLAAGWLGLEVGAPVHWKVALRELPEGHALVLVDSPEDAARLGLAEPAGPSLALVASPVDPESRLLVVGGRTSQELVHAALRLGAQDLVLAGSKVDLSAPQGGPREPHVAPRWVATDRVIPITRYPGVPSTEYVGAVDGAIRVTFRLPPDLWTWPATQVELELGTVVRASRDRPPTLSAELNGLHLGEIPIAKEGEAEGRVRFLVPSDRLRGFNELRVGIHTGQAFVCGAPPERSVVRVALTNASVLHVEGLARAARVGDVARFVHDGWPFTRRADLSATTLLLGARPSEAELSTALSFATKVASITGRAPLGLKVGTLDTLPSEGDSLAIGAWSELAGTAVGAALPLLPEEAIRLAPLDPLQQLLDALSGGPALISARAASARLAAIQAGAVVVGTPISGSERALIAVTATDAAHLPSLPDLGGRAQAEAPEGDVLLSADGELWLYGVRPARLGGAIGPVVRVRRLISDHWVLLGPGALLGATLVGRRLRAIVRRRTADRLGGGAS